MKATIKKKKKRVNILDTLRVDFIVLNVIFRK